MQHFYNRKAPLFLQGFPVGNHFQLGCIPTWEVFPSKEVFPSLEAFPVENYFPFRKSFPGLYVFQLGSGYQQPDIARYRAAIAAEKSKTTVESLLNH